MRASMETQIAMTIRWPGPSSSRKSISPIRKRFWPTRISDRGKKDGRASKRQRAKGERVVGWQRRAKARLSWKWNLSPAVAWRPSGRKSRKNRGKKRLL